MPAIAHNLEELIGHTPLLELNRYGAKHQFQARVLAKLEYLNPAGSAKDRVALSMILDGGGAGAPAARRRHHRAHLRQHGHRSGQCGGRPGVPGDPHHARHHERRAPGHAGRLRGGAGAHPRGPGHAGGGGQGPGAGPGAARQLHPRPV